MLRLDLELNTAKWAREVGALIHKTYPNLNAGEGLEAGIQVKNRSDSHVVSDHIQVSCITSPNRR